MTLSAGILSMVILLGLLLTAVLAANFLPAWRQARQAEIHRMLNIASTDLIEAAGALAVERGLTNGVLAAPATSAHRSNRRLPVAAPWQTKAWRMAWPCCQAVAVGV